MPTVIHGKHSKSEYCFLLNTRSISTKFNNNSIILTEHGIYSKNILTVNWLLIF
jgi:hypothetical protein